MSRNYDLQYKEEKMLQSRNDKWIRGLNTTVSNTQIRADELSEAQDIQLVEDGKVKCPRDGQDYYGTSTDSRVMGLFPFYKSDGTRKLVRMSGSSLYAYSSTSAVAITGAVYTTGLPMNGVIAYDRLYLANGTDALTYYDGASVTSFSGISAPSTASVSFSGSTGTFTYSYKVTAVNTVGETTPTAAATAIANVSSLSTTAYTTVSWTAVSGAVGYNLYGRKDGTWRHMIYLEGANSVTYNDTGTVTPNELQLPPEGNTTTGPKGKYIALYKDSLFIAGDPTNPSRMYYSGGGDHVHDFTVGGGGGFLDVSKNDGQVITGMIVFKNKLLVFKEESIYQFSFTTDGLPQIEQVSSSLGAVAPRSIVAVENDIFFASRRGVFTIGNEAGFAFDVLRTNELSARIRSVYQGIDPAYIQNIAAIYTTDADANLVIFAYTPSGMTTNSKAIVYDRERLGWYKWSNMQANCWTTWRGTDQVNHYLYGDDASGYVKEILSGSNDFGTAIRGYFRIRAEDFKELNRYKKLKDVDLVLREPTGTVQVNIIKDGVDTVQTVPITTISPSVNFGHYVLSEFLFGESVGTGVSTQDENLLRTFRNLNLEGRSFLLEFDNLGTAASFTLLETSMSAKPRSVRYRKSEEVVAI